MCVETQNIEITSYLLIFYGLFQIIVIKFIVIKDKYAAMNIS